MWALITVILSQPFTSLDVEYLALKNTTQYFYTEKLCENNKHTVFKAYTKTITSVTGEEVISHYISEVGTCVFVPRP